MISSMAKYLFSGATLLSGDLSGLSSLRGSTLPTDTRKAIEQRWLEQSGGTDFDLCMERIESLIGSSDPDSSLDAVQSLAFALILSAHWKHIIDLDLAVESAKVWPRFQKRWFKILFESKEVVESSQSGTIGTLRTNGGYVIGAVSRDHIARLKKVDELHEYLVRQNSHYEVLAKGKKLEQPGLILDLGAIGKPASTPELLGADGKSYRDKWAELEAEEKRRGKPKLNELQKEEGDFDTEFLSEKFVKGLFKVKQSGQDLAIVTRWMEMLR